jgi:sugar lactone lactonase YvrE
MNAASVNVDIRCVASSADVCGEGALWHAMEHAIYWTDINRKLLHRFCVDDTNVVETWHFNEPVTALALTANPREILVVLGGTILLWNRQEDRRDKVIYKLPSWPKARCNDARVDPAGRLWFGTMQNNVAEDGSARSITEHIGSLQSFDSSCVTRQWHNRLGVQNTIAWSPSEDTMLFGDTLRNEIYACDYERTTGDIAGKRIFCEGFTRGLPDGSAMDSEGFLWNCRYGGGCIVRFALDGSVDRVIETPVPNPTSCAFGGEELKTLYFTSAGEGKQIAGPEDGGLFCFNTGVRGLAIAPFALKY